MCSIQFSLAGSLTDCSRPSWFYSFPRKPAGVIGPLPLTFWFHLVLHKTPPTPTPPHPTAPATGFPPGYMVQAEAGPHGLWNTSLAWSPSHVQLLLLLSSLGVSPHPIPHPPTSCLGRSVTCVRIAYLSSLGETLVSSAMK